MCCCVVLKEIDRYLVFLAVLHNTRLCPRMLVALVLSTTRSFILKTNLLHQNTVAHYNFKQFSSTLIITVPVLFYCLEKSPTYRCFVLIVCKVQTCSLMHFLSRNCETTWDGRNSWLKHVVVNKRMNKYSWCCVVRKAKTNTSTDL